MTLYVLVLLLLTKPVGLYLTRVLHADGKTFLDPALKPVERLFYRVLGVDPRKEQDGKEYTFSLIAFSFVGLLFTYAILRLQDHLTLNPQGFGVVSPDLAFNTAVSFTTNTNWQSYGGESTLSYFSQMVGLVFHNFVSAAAGIAIAAALVRGIARNSSKTIGHFWVDLIRVNLYLLLPLCIVYAVFLVSQGMAQNFKPYEEAVLVEPLFQQAPLMGPDGQEIWCKADYLSIEDQKSFSGRDAFCDEHGVVTDEFPGSTWNTSFRPVGESTNVDIEISYENLSDLEKIIQMGFKEGFTAALGNLDELLNH
jgi:K+-transporting ATPase ATPase A chain